MELSTMGQVLRLSLADGRHDVPTAVKLVQTCKTLRDAAKTRILTICFGQRGKPAKYPYEGPGTLWLHNQARALIQAQAATAKPGLGDDTWELRRHLKKWNWCDFSKIGALGLRCNMTTTDADLEALARSCAALKSLDLTYTRAVTDEGIKALAKGCQGLENLSLWGRDRVGDEAIKALADVASLRSLVLGNCDRVTDDGIKALTKCTRLRAVNLKECGHITDDAIVALATCPQLDSLNLSRTQISDVGVHALTRCPALTSLNLRDCRGVSGAGLAGLSGVTTLQELNLWGSDTLTDGAVAALVGGAPGLRSIVLGYVLLSPHAAIAVTTTV